jgi:hypothetical protein
MKQEIKPTYITFEQAKWLKEKGFHSIKCLAYSLEGFELNNYCYNLEGDKQWTAKPEQWQVVEWLRVNHGIWIQVSISRYGVFYCNILQDQKTKNLDIPMSYEMICQLNDFNSPQEAYSAAFDYIKDNNLNLITI